MLFGEGEKERVQLSDELTPEEMERLKTAVRMLVNYLLDNAPRNCENEKQTNDERVQATTPQAEQLRLKI